VLTVQPLYEISLTRPWHWGIAIASAPGAPVPDDLGTSLVVGDSACLVLKVRHAQDVELERFEGDWDWATATVHVRSLTSLEEPEGLVLYEGELTLPDGRLTLGDADSEVAINDLERATRVRVRCAVAEETGMEEVWLDLAPRAQ
jgi:hypothetical protein